VELEAGVLLVRGHRAELRQLAHRGEQLGRPARELGRIGVLDRVLVLRAADPRVDREVLDRLEIDPDSVDALERVLQAVDDRGHARVAIVVRLERDREPAAVGRRVDAVRADR